MRVAGRLSASMMSWLCLLPAGLSEAAENSRPESGQLLGGKQTRYPDWFKDSFLEFADDVEEAAAEGRRVVIFFHQDDCPYCNALVERNLSQKPIEEKIRANFDVIALNLRGDREVVSVAGRAYTEKGFARALNIQFTPTLLFLDESGKVILRLNGYVQPREFELALDYASQRLEKTSDYRDFLANRLKAVDSGNLNEAPFFEPPPYDLSNPVKFGTPFAVFFEQRQCPSCDILHREVLSDPETHKLIASFHAVQLDMWSEQPVVPPSGRPTTARAWAEALDVRYAPTIVLFSSDGREVIRSEAYFKRFHTQSLFDYVASGIYREEPDFQRYLTDRADAIRAEGQDVDIWK
jgi:thioredoxin-related protein